MEPHLGAPGTIRAPLQTCAGSREVDDPNATLLKVDVDEVEYWDTPGGKIASIVSLAKTKLTGETYDADHGTVATSGPER